MSLNETNNDSDVAHLTSFGIDFQTEEGAKENRPSPCATLLCAGLLRRGIVCELERVLRECDGFSGNTSVTMMVQYCSDSGSTNKLFCM